MRTFGFALLPFVVGLVAGFAATVFGVFAWMDHANVFDRDGGLAMGVFFTLGPVGGIVIGTVAAVATAAVMRRRRNASVAGTRPPVHRWPLGMRAAVAALAWAAGVWAAVAGIFWLLSPMRFESYEAAVAVSWLPLGLPLVAAMLAAGFVLWRRAPDAV